MALKCVTFFSKYTFQLHLHNAEIKQLSLNTHFSCLSSTLPRNAEIKFGNVWHYARRNKQWAPDTVGNAGRPSRAIGLSREIIYLLVATTFVRLNFMALARKVKVNLYFLKCF